MACIKKWPTARSLENYDLRYFGLFQQISTTRVKKRKKKKSINLGWLKEKVVSCDTIIVRGVKCLQFFGEDFCSFGGAKSPEPSELSFLHDTE